MTSSDLEGHSPVASRFDAIVRAALSSGGDARPAGDDRVSCKFVFKRNVKSLIVSYVRRGEFDRRETGRRHAMPRRVQSSSRIIAALRHVTDTSLSLRISDTELQTPAEQQHRQRLTGFSLFVRNY